MGPCLCLFFLLKIRRGGYVPQSGKMRLHSYCDDNLSTRHKTACCPLPAQHPTYVANPPEPIVLVLQGVFEGKGKICKKIFFKTRFVLTPLPRFRASHSLSRTYGPEHEMDAFQTNPLLSPPPLPHPNYSCEERRAHFLSLPPPLPRQQQMCPAQRLGHFRRHLS